MLRRVRALRQLVRKIQGLAILRDWMGTAHRVLAAASLRARAGRWPRRFTKRPGLNHYCVRVLTLKNDSAG
jgi:hypothetical protein